MLQHYEMLYIVPVKFAGAEFEKIQNKVKDLIKKEGGEIDYEEDLGKKKLAYIINHNTQGFYVLYEFDIEVDKIKTLNEKIKLTSEVLRHLIVKKKKLTDEERKKAKEKKVDLPAGQAGKKEGTKMAAQFDIEKQLEASEPKAEKLKETEKTVEDKITTDKVEKTETTKTEVDKKKEDKEDAKKSTSTEATADKEEEKTTKKKDDKIKLEELDKKLDEIIDDSII